MFYSLIKPLLFQLEAEKAHDFALAALRYAPAFCFEKIPVKPVTSMGLTFPHPVGLAAGLDKNGQYLDALAKLGFAFIELGTVTPRPQLGNPKPRLFRVREAKALINRMGFNNHGVDALVKNVQKARYRGIIGINIGKNKDTSLSNAVEDYLYCLKKIYLHASYVTINISSPNTPDLRQLQQKDYFRDLIKKLHEARKKLSDHHQKNIPLLIKISPDETDETLKTMADTIISYGLDGIIATNTTCARDEVSGLTNAQEAGGLSGMPLAQRSTHCLAILKEVVGDAITLVGVGGIDNAAVAAAKLKAGATLLQIYTGLIYKGPELVSSLVKSL